MLSASFTSSTAAVTSCRSAEVAGDGPGFTSDWRENPLAAAINVPRKRIDYVFVRGPDTRVRGKPLAARVVMDEVENGVAATDHYGVYAEITI